MIDGLRHFVFEASLGVIALVLIGAGLAILIARDAAIESLPVVGRWILSIRHAAAAVLIGVGAATLGFSGGYMQRGTADQSEALQSEIARQKALVAARDATAAEAARRAREIAAAQAAAALKADLIAANNRRLAQLSEYDDAASHDRDTAPCLDLGGLRRLDIGDGGRSR